MVTWEDIYQKYGIVQRRVDSFIAKNIDLLKEYGVKVYDYGAGTGRNALYLAKFGFDVTTFDPSFSSRELLSGSINDKLKNRIHILQTPLNGFSKVDVSLSINSIHHGTYNNIIEGIHNLIMPVRKEGLILFKGLSHTDPKSQYGIKIEKKTRKNIPGWKDGCTPHHFFIEYELHELFSKLDIISIEEKKESVEFFEDKAHNYLELIARRR